MSDVKNVSSANDAAGAHLHRMVLRLAELARRSHYYCEDTWYSCPKHPEGCIDDYAGAGAECNCGADRINAEVDVILAQLSAWL